MGGMNDMTDQQYLIEMQRGRIDALAAEDELRRALSTILTIASRHSRPYERRVEEIVTVATAALKEKK